MAFPISIDSFVNPTGTDLALNHAELHTAINQAVIALETSLGITGSADVNSVIFKLATATTRLSNLSNVDNTADLNKPLSIAMNAALNNKVSTLTTVNGKALSGNITILQADVGLGNVDNTSDATKNSAFATLINKTFNNALNSLVIGADQSFGGFKITSLAEPTLPQDGVTKNYVDRLLLGTQNKISARATTTSLLPSYTYNNGVLGVGATITAAAAGILTTDGISLVLNDYILVKNEAQSQYNGVYKVTTEGTISVPFVLTRAIEQDQPAEFAGSYVFVSSGSMAGTGWSCTSIVTSVGSNQVTFVQSSAAIQYLAGAGLQLIGNSFSIDGTVATLSGVQTLSNKTLASPVVSGVVDLSLGGIKFSNDPSGLIERSYIGTIGACYTLLQAQSVGDTAMKVWIHNSDIDITTGNFVGRGATGACYMIVLTQNGRFDRYDAPSDIAGTVPVFSYTHPMGTAKTTTVINTTGGTYTLTSSEAFSDSFEITGVLTSDATIIVPNTMQVVSFENLTTGAFLVTIKTLNGGGFVFSATDKNVKRLCYANGTNNEVLSLQDISTIVSAKTTPIDADEVISINSVSSSFVRTTWTNIKSFLKTYFDTLYNPLVTPGTSGNVLTSNGTVWQSVAPSLSPTSTTTLTNKRITKRIVTVTQAALPTYNTDNGDIFQITGLAQAITSMTTNMAGTPTEGDMILFEITDNGTAQAITWGASFASGTSATLPTTTVATITKTVLLKRTGAVWKCLAVD